MSANTFRATNTASAAQGGVDVFGGLNLPSIFDILSQQSLNSSLKPALQNLLKVLSDWDPKRFRQIHRFYDEFHAIFMFVLENHYLKHYSASFAENFYGMRRTLVADPKQSFPFRDFRSRLKSLVVLVVLPYLKDKIKKFVQRMNAAYPQQRSALVRFLLRSYPYIVAVVRAVVVLFQVLYVFCDYAPAPFCAMVTTPSPLLWLIGVFLERLTPADVEAFASTPLHHQNSGLLAKFWRLLLSAMSLSGRLFSYGVFFLQFVEYFYANDLSKELAAFSESGDLVPPTAPTHPRKVIPSENYVLTCMEPGKCPLCYKRRVNDTTLSVSGYVFCYACIVDYVSRERRCPITQLPATIQQLIRLYTT